MGAWPSFRGAIFDLDGTIYRGDEPIPGAIETLHRLSSAGVRCGFVSNNSTRSGAEFAAKLRAMGYPAADSDVIGTADAAGTFVVQRHGIGALVYVVGAPALREALVASGLRLAGEGETAQAVVVGLDQDLTYATLRAAIRQIVAGADFIATNPDRLFPLPDGLAPGAGTIVAAVAAGVSHLREPVFVGKPYLPMMTQALARLGTSAADTIMVGDQISTDIAAGQAAGMFSVLVTTGVPQEATSIVPDRTVANLLDIPTPSGE